MLFLNNPKHIKIYYIAINPDYVPTFNSEPIPETRDSEQIQPGNRTPPMAGLKQPRQEVAITFGELVQEFRKANPQWYNFMKGELELSENQIGIILKHRGFNIEEISVDENGTIVTSDTGTTTFDNNYFAVINKIELSGRKSNLLDPNFEKSLRDMTGLDTAEIQDLVARNPVLLQRGIRLIETATELFDQGQRSIEVILKTGQTEIINYKARAEIGYSANAVFYPHAKRVKMRKLLTQNQINQFAQQVRPSNFDRLVRIQLNPNSSTTVIYIDSRGLENKVILDSQSNSTPESNNLLPNIIKELNLLDVPQNQINQFAQKAKSGGHKVVSDLEYQVDPNGKSRIIFRNQTGQTITIELDPQVSNRPIYPSELVAEDASGKSKLI
jgi:hypothetical protein